MGNKVINSLTSRLVPYNIETGGSSVLTHNHCQVRSYTCLAYSMPHQRYVSLHQITYAWVRLPLIQVPLADSES